MLRNPVLLRDFFFFFFFSGTVYKRILLSYLLAYITLGDIADSIAPFESMAEDYVHKTLDSLILKTLHPRTQIVVHVIIEKDDGAVRGGVTLSS